VSTSAHLFDGPLAGVAAKMIAKGNRVAETEAVAELDPDTGYPRPGRGVPSHGSPRSIKGAPASPAPPSRLWAAAPAPSSAGVSSQGTDLVVDLLSGSKGDNRDADSQVDREEHELTSTAAPDVLVAGAQVAAGGPDNRRQEEDRPNGEGHRDLSPCTGRPRSSLVAATALHAAHAITASAARATLIATALGSPLMTRV
jgi:hypothetical protein